MLDFRKCHVETQRAVTQKNLYKKEVLLASLKENEQPWFLQLTFLFDTPFFQGTASCSCYYVDRQYRKCNMMQWHNEVL